jgi:LCP family protein required for cell wall assembly
VTRLESTLHTLSVDPFEQPAPADLADRALTRARQRTRRRGALAVVGAATVATLVAIGVSTAVGEQRPTATPAAKATATGAASAFAEPRMNVLLVGTDAAPDRIGLRPDTLIVASIDTKTGDTSLFGLPRNLQHVPFPAGSAAAKDWPDGWFCANDTCLLNSLWFWAENDGKRYYPGAKNPGLTATKQAAEQITGLTVDETVTVNMQGLVQLVNAVGGVDVNVKERLPIGGSPANQGGTSGWLEPGKQHLDGKAALWYARSRWSTSDYDRMHRQQCLLTALSEQVDAGKVVANLPQLAKALRQNLATSIEVDDLPAWTDLATRMRKAQIRQVGLVPPDRTDPDFAAIRRQVAELLDPKAPARTSSQGGAKGKDLGWVSSGSC